MAAEARAAAGDAPICKPDIEASQEGRDMQDEEAVEEAYGGVSVLVSLGRQSAYSERT